MNRRELIEQVSASSEMPFAVCEAVIGAMFDRVVEEVAQGREVSLWGLGEFSRRQRAARVYRNPRTDELLEKDAVRSMAFRAYQSLDAIAGAFDNE